MVSEPATTLDPQEWANMIVLQDYLRKKLRHSVLISSFAKQFTEGESAKIRISVLIVAYISFPSDCVSQSCYLHSSKSEHIFHDLQSEGNPS